MMKETLREDMEKHLDCRAMVCAKPVRGEGMLTKAEAPCSDRFICVLSSTHCWMFQALNQQRLLFSFTTQLKATNNKLNTTPLLVCWTNHRMYSGLSTHRNIKRP